jgi:hypothetical protein
MAEFNDTLKTADGRYIVRVVADSRGGFRAKLYSRAAVLAGSSEGPIMEPHAGDKISAVLQLIKELNMDFSTGDKEIARQIDKELEKSLLKAESGTPATPPATGLLKIGDSGLEKDFHKFEKLKKTTSENRVHALGYPDERALAEVILGDQNYTKRFRMPKYNGGVSMLRDHKVAIKYASELGIPASKSAHSQRADHYDTLAKRFNRAWQDLVKRASKKFGDPGPFTGPFISGVYREHFPGAVKDRLRFLAHGETMLKDATRLHQALSKTRSFA